MTNQHINLQVWSNALKGCFVADVISARLQAEPLDGSVPQIMGSHNHCKVPLMSLQRQLRSHVIKKENPKLIQSPQMGPKDPWVWGISG